MKLQLALDTPDLTHELELAGKVAAYVDLIEAGTPLLIREGIRAVRELRRRHRGRPIVADIKVIDDGEPIAELAFTAVHPQSAAERRHARRDPPRQSGVGGRPGPVDPVG